MSDLKEQTTRTLAKQQRSGPASTAPGVKIVILGLMGSGKTAVGVELARRLGLPYSDSDQTIVAATGMTAREIQETSELLPLHTLEASHLLDALQAPAPIVISAAASVVETSRCRTALRARNVLGIWLRAKPETLVKRFHNEQHRPTFGDPAVFFREQMAGRSPHFRKLSAATIDVDDLSVADVVTAAEGIVRSRLALTV